MNSSYASMILNPIQNQMNLKHINHRLSMGKFNILYLNINSILHKLDEIEIHLHSILKDANKTIHCIALTEVRIHEHQTSFFNIPSYTSFYSTRNDGYGGCALFVHESNSAHLVERQSKNNIDCITVNLMELSTSIIIVYKQPAVNNDVLMEFLNVFTDNKKNFILLGDMNLNLLNNSHIVKKYIDFWSSSGCIPLNKISETFATRIAHRTISNCTLTSNTIIDHIITDCLKFSFKLSYCDTPLSDHRELLLSVDNNKSADFIQTEKSTSYEKLDIYNYNADLENFLAHGNINTFDNLIDGTLTNLGSQTNCSILSMKEKDIFYFVKNLLQMITLELNLIQFVI